MNERALKLLEVATHPTTGDGERSNALGMFRKMADNKGGLAKLLGFEGDKVDYWWEQYRKLKQETQHHPVEVRRLTAERDEALRRFNEMRAAMNALTNEAGDHDNPMIALYGALTNDWQSLAPLITKARANGFAGADNTIRNRADKLAAKGIIEVKEAEGWEGRMWRHKQ